MNQVTEQRPSNAEAITQQRAANAVAAFRPPRLPFHPAIEERFGIDQASWRALVEAVFPLAISIDSVILALSYCRARKLDPFKRVVYIVPIWSKADGKMVDTVWPGIGELRTTAFRTGLYAGRDDAEFGPALTKKFGTIEVTFPEWCKVTVHRICGGETRSFSGPKVYWLETYATRGRNDPGPNDMWAKRTRGQLEKCAEAAALRAAFPEELGDEETVDEAESKSYVPKDITPPARPTRSEFAGADFGASAAALGASEEVSSEANAADAFALVDADGVEIMIADPMDWGNQFYSSLKAAAGNVQIAQGLWEINSAQLQRFRDEVPEGAKFADQIEDAYGAAIGSNKKGAVKERVEEGGQQQAATPTPTAAPAQQQATASAATPHALGNLPKNAAGSFDAAAAVRILGDAIESSASLEDVTEWQKLNMDWIEWLSKNAPPFAKMVEKRVAAVREILAGAEA